MPQKKYFFIESTSPLYEDVQSGEIFPDSKFFVDCIPKSTAEEIVKAYTAAKQQKGFDLKAFVEAHFILPADGSTGYESAHKPIGQHLHELWNVLQRSPATKEEGTLIPLPFPYIVPGGRFREIYYWDTYFTILGLQVSGEVGLIQNMVDNFAYLISEIGFIPNGNRTYYLGRSQPPFFALMVKVLCEEKGETTLLQYRGALEKEYAFWMDGEGQLKEPGNSYRRVVSLPGGLTANRYWDDYDTPRPEAYMEDRHLAGKSANPPGITYRHIRAAAESGWDFSGRWFADGQNMQTIQTTDIIPVDLNCLLLHLEETLLQIYTMIANETLKLSFKHKIINRKKVVQAFCWDAGKGFYFDYNHVQQTRASAYTLAAMYPLFFKIAEPGQAEKTAGIIKEKFLHPGGLATTLNNTGQQWDAPNGWAPLQWMAYSGLLQYGLKELAEQIKERWTTNCANVYANTGKMMEKYNVMNITTNAGGGEYPNQDGFGWTNGVFLKLKM